jgi:chromosome segregation ATPase
MFEKLFGTPKAADEMQSIVSQLQRVTGLGADATLVELDTHLAGLESFETVKTTVEAAVRAEMSAEIDRLTAELQSATTATDTANQALQIAQDTLLANQSELTAAAVATANETKRANALAGELAALRVKNATADAEAGSAGLPKPAGTVTTLPKTGAIVNTAFDN